MKQTSRVEIEFDDVQKASELQTKHFQIRIVHD